MPSALLAALSFAVAGLLLLNRLLTDLVILVTSQRWPRIEGTIHPDADDCPQPRLTIRYRVGERTYATHRVSPFAWLHRYDTARMKTLRARFPAGSPVAVRHHPRSPGLAIVVPGAPAIPDLLLLLIGIALCSAGAYGALTLEPPVFSISDYGRVLLETYGVGIEQGPGIPPQILFASQVGPIRFLRLPLAVLCFWTWYRWFQCWFLAGRSPTWPLAPARIVSDEHIWVEGPRILGIGRDRLQREVRYTYRAQEHRFESDRVTFCGNPTDSFLAGESWEGEEPIETDAIVPVYHRPGKPHESLIVPGWRIARHGIMWLTWQMLFWTCLAAWVSDMSRVRILPHY